MWIVGDIGPSVIFVYFISLLQYIGRQIFLKNPGRYRRRALKYIVLISTESDWLYDLLQTLLLCCIKMSEISALDGDLSSL